MCKRKIQEENTEHFRDSKYRCLKRLEKDVYKEINKGRDRAVG